MENLLQDKKIRIDPEWKEILERCEREGKDLLERMKTDPEYRALLEKLNREGERLLAEIRDKKISDV